MNLKPEASACPVRHTDCVRVAVAAGIVALVCAVLVPVVAASPGEGLARINARHDNDAMGAGTRALLIAYEKPVPTGGREWEKVVPLLRAAQRDLAQIHPSTDRVKMAARLNRIALQAAIRLRSGLSSSADLKRAVALFIRDLSGATALEKKEFDPLFAGNYRTGSRPCTVGFPAIQNGDGSAISLTGCQRGLTRVRLTIPVTGRKGVSLLRAAHKRVWVGPMHSERRDARLQATKHDVGKLGDVCSLSSAP